MPDLVSVLIVLALIICALVAWFTTPECLGHRRASERNQIAAIKDDADDAIARIDATYRQSLRDIRRRPLD